MSMLCAPCCWLYVIMFAYSSRGSLRTKNPLGRWSASGFRKACPERPGMSAQWRSGQCIEYARADFIDGAKARDPPILRRLQAIVVAMCRPRVVVLDQRLGLRDIHVEPLLHGLFLVVVALDQRLTGDVVLAFLLRRIELDVISTA